MLDRTARHPAGCRMGIGDHGRDCRGEAAHRVRHWGRVVDARDGNSRILRVVTLDDGQTIHNAFYDRDFREDAP